MAVKIIRMATIGLSLDTFCRGLLQELSADYEVVALSSPDSHLDSLGKREGVRTIGVEMKREIAPLADLRSLIRLVREFRRERPQMVHTMTPKAGLLGMMAARIAGVPLRVHTFTGLLFPTATGLKKQILRLTDRLTCACATHIIPEGEGVRNDLIAGGITRKPLRVLGHGNVRGVDLDHYRPSESIDAQAAELRRRFGIRPGDKVLLYAGRADRDKGITELTKAFRTLGRKDTHLLLAGDFKDSPLLPADMSNIHLSDGWTADIRPWMRAADIFILPSYREGFPNTVLEAGAMCRPSVVTDINGSREIITDCVNGLIVEPRTVAPLREAILKLISDPALCHEMGLRARKNVELKFSQPYVRSCLKEFYRTIIPTAQ